MILVGGQALAFWMDRYGLRPTGALISADGDALGTLESARQLARQLRAEMVAAPPTAMTALIAQVRVPQPGGKAANVDILHKLFALGGLRKSAEFTKRVIAHSVKVEWGERIVFRVMDPFDVLSSRVQNAAGLLEDKGPHVLTQARWAIKVAKAALMKLAKAGAAPDTTSTKRLGAALKSIYALAHSAAGRKILKEHRIEVLDAVDIDKLVKLSPAHAPQLKRLAHARIRRSSPAAAGRGPRSG